MHVVTKCKTQPIKLLRNIVSLITHFPACVLVEIKFSREPYFYLFEESSDGGLLFVCSDELHGLLSDGK